MFLFILECPGVGFAGNTGPRQRGSLRSVVFMNKLTVRKVKLALTTDCNLSCPYCFVEQDEGVMSWGVARDAVDLLLRSAGREKLLSLYGGEPLLCFDLVARVVRYARVQAGKTGKILTINLCTNLLLLDPQMALFFAREDVKVIVSVVGLRRDHDRIRLSATGVGSYSGVVKNLPLLFEYLPRLNIGAAFCVHPLTVGSLLINWAHLLELGFRHVNIEIIRDQHGWTERRQSLFAVAMKAIAREVLIRASSADPVYLNPVNWEIRNGLLTRPGASWCPFEYFLEVYPRGGVACSPFLHNSPDIARYQVAVQPARVARPAYCNGQLRPAVCAECRQKYLSAECSFPGADQVRREYLRQAVAVARALQSSSRRRDVRRYLDSIRQEVCF
ncbi:MAG: 4Fe-4S cluster-binding domain-containing protein [Candidatus Omnitrophica bacterium]|nr:4Fe-4S cluster-binding domain-containing protein [Candidatus Omnitrophota bacterium]